MKDQDFLEQKIMDFSVLFFFFKGKKKGEKKSLFAAQSRSQVYVISWQYCCCLALSGIAKGTNQFIVIITLFTSRNKNICF